MIECLHPNNQLMKYLSRCAALAAVAGICMIVTGIAGDRTGLWLPGVSLFCVGVALFGGAKVASKKR